MSRPSPGLTDSPFQDPEAWWRGAVVTTAKHTDDTMSEISTGVVQP
jgi:hypothetical protein